MKFYIYNERDMTFHKISAWRYVVLFICLLTLMSISRSTDMKDVDEEREVSLISSTPTELKFSRENLMIVIERSGIRFPDIVFAQAVLETGHFRSDIFREGNNLFGMKVARSRPTTAIGEYSGHAMYDDWVSSVIDYALYQSAYLRKLKTEDQYYEYLSQHYAEDPEYVNKLKRYETTKR